MLKYPDRFSLPGEIEIKKTISTLAQKKEGRANYQYDTRKRQQCEIHEWERNLKEMVRHCWEEALKGCYQNFKSDMVDDPSTWPSDIPTIRNKDNTTSINMKKIKAIIILALLNRKQKKLEKGHYLTRTATSF